MAKKRITKTDRLYARAAKMIVGPGQGHKRIRQSFGPEYPEYLVRGRGCRVWDVEGREYIDYLCSYGPILLGHCYPKVDAAVRKQMRGGTIFNTEHPLQIQVAEALCQAIPCAQMVAFFIGGSGATLGATRIARAYTGRDHIIKMGYHGWHDWCHPDLNGNPSFWPKIVHTVPYNDLEAMEKCFRRYKAKIAGVMMEPGSRDMPPKSYFDAVQRLCHREGSLFMLDEVKTGFRLALGGAQEVLKINPDLATFGKGMANGYPGSVVVGKKKILSKCGSLWLAATFHAETLSLAATLAVIDEIKEKNVTAHLWKMGRRLMDGINGIAKERGIDFEMVGFAPMPSPWAKTDEAKKIMNRVWAQAALNGVFIHPSHPWFVCYMHKQKDIDETLDKIQSAVKKVVGGV